MTSWGITICSLLSLRVWLFSLCAMSGNDSILLNAFTGLHIGFGFQSCRTAAREVYAVCTFPVLDQEEVVRDGPGALGARYVDGWAYRPGSPALVSHAFTENIPALGVEKLLEDDMPAV